MQQGSSPPTQSMFHGLETALNKFSTSCQMNTFEEETPYDAVGAAAVQLTSDKRATWTGDNVLIDNYVQNVENGATYSEDGFFVRQNGHITLKPVPNIVFSALILPLILSSSDAKTQFVWIGLPQLILAVVAMVFQISSTVYIFLMMEGAEEASCFAGGSTLLRVICVSVFCSLVLSEIRESLDFFKWTMRLPTWNEKDRAVLEELHTGFAVKKKTIKVKYGGDQIEFKVNHIVAGGVSKYYRCLMILVGSVMKGIVELGVLVGGTSYIVYADSNENILLNAVSLLFILEIDNYMYNCVSSDVMKRFVENATPEIALLKGTKEETGDQHYIMKVESKPKPFLESWVLLFLLSACTALPFFWCWR